ncbi:heptaprenyl diphosphate synthase component 1 [Virgibacillus sp. W0430]|uniref:heptaprenyl diphosphate synthase component 1 n=1 Tax=Virgibacillus sp. W0430 TaxID=3391580 RepID=UPI003F44EAAB
MSSSTIDTEEMLALIENKIKHSFIEKYIEKPVIDKEKLYLLTTLLNQSKLSKYKKKQYILTTMLVQIALDTHELVPVANDKTEHQNERTKKQLYVLAGDYYSGLYYALLASIEDMEMIQVLATAIKEINEYKMKLFYNEYGSFAEFVALIGKIETLLITRIAETISEKNIIPLIEPWLTMNQLIKEKEKLEIYGYSNLFEYWFQSMNSNLTSISSDYDSFVNNSIEKTEAILDTFPNHLKPLKAHVQQRLQQVRHNCSTLVEEGQQ